jgi:MFS family permease
MLARYFGFRSFSTLYGLTWTAYAFAGAIGPILMGRAFDLTGSYAALLSATAAATVGVALLMLLMPAYSCMGWSERRHAAAI